MHRALTLTPSDVLAIRDYIANHKNPPALRGRILELMMEIELFRRTTIDNKKSVSQRIQEQVINNLKKKDKTREQHSTSG